jgi:hypothetical protein
MNDEDLENSGRGLIEVLSRHLPGGTEDRDENPVRRGYVLGEIQIEHPPNTYLEHYHYAWF